MEPDEAEPKRRGRPPGSKNKPKLGDPRPAELEDYQHSDPATLVSRQFSLIEYGQSALRTELRLAQANKRDFITSDDVDRLLKMSNALSRTVEALKRTADVAEEMAKRMTPADLLEAAIKKIEGQDVATLNYALKRLRAHKERLESAKTETKVVGPTSATTAIADLGELDE